MRIHHDIEFMKLTKKLKHVSNINEKITLLKKITSLKPRDPKHLTRRKEYKEELESLMVKRKGQKKRQAKSPYELINFKRKVVLIGTTNTGKSTLLSKLTKTRPDIKDTPFTTYNPETGMMKYKDVLIQVVELPSLLQSDSDSDKYKFIRNSNVICVCIKAKEDLDFAIKQLEDYHILLVNSPSDSDKKFRPLNETNKKPALIAAWANVEGTNLPILDINDEKAIMGQIYLLLNIKRIYSITKGKIDDQPSVFPANQEITVADFAKALDRRLASKFNRAKITGPSAKYEKQTVSLHYVLNDGDAVELIK